MNQKPSIASAIGSSNNTDTTTCQNPNTYTHFFKGVLGCFGGLFIHLVIASLYQWGIINIYVTSYYKVTSDTSITLEKNSIVFPLMMVSIGLTMRLGLFLAKHVGVLITLYLCNFFTSAMILISSFMPNFYGFIAFYGIIFGLIAGLTFMIPIVQCNKFFPGKKMYVNGLILVGTGIGSMVFGLFSYNYINPDKQSPVNGYYSSQHLESIALRVPSCLRYLSLLYFIIGTLGTTMLIPVYRYNTEYAKTHKIIDIGQHDASSICQAFTSWLFWRKFLTLIFATCGVFLINGNYKTYVKQEIHDDGFLTLIGTIGAIGNGCSRFFWNVLFNRTGYKFVMLLNISLCIIVLSTVRFTVSTPPLYLVLVFCMNCCLGGYLVITPTFSQIAFGPQVGSNIYGCFWQTYALANFIQYFYVSFLNDVIGFDNIIYICLGMAVIAIPLVTLGKWQGPWGNLTNQLEYCYHISQVTNQDLPIQYGTEQDQVIPHKVQQDIQQPSADGLIIKNEREQSFSEKQNKQFQQVNKIIPTSYNQDEKFEDIPQKLSQRSNLSQKQKNGGSRIIKIKKEHSAEINSVKQQ